MLVVDTVEGVELHEGYCTLDEYHWICTACFTDFRDRFEWKVVSEDGSQ